MTVLNTWYLSTECKYRKDKCDWSISEQISVQVVIDIKLWTSVCASMDILYTFIFTRLFLIHEQKNCFLELNILEEFTICSQLAISIRFFHEQHKIWISWYNENYQCDSIQQSQHNVHIAKFVICVQNTCSSEQISICAATDRLVLDFIAGISNKSHFTQNLITVASDPGFRNCELEVRLFVFCLERCQRH